MSAIEPTDEQMKAARSFMNSVYAQDNVDDLAELAALFAKREAVLRAALERRPAYQREAAVEAELVTRTGERDRALKLLAHRTSQLGRDAKQADEVCSHCTERTTPFFDDQKGGWLCDVCHHPVETKDVADRDDNRPDITIVVGGLAGPTPAEARQKVADTLGLERRRRAEPDDTKRGG